MADNKTIAQLDTQAAPAGGDFVLIADGNTAKKATLTSMLGATLSSIKTKGSAAGRYLYTTALNTWAEGVITAFGRSLLDDANAAAARATLGVVPGTDVQAQDPELQALAGVTSAADVIPYFTAAETAGALQFLDEDDMVSNSAAGVSSQQATKAYVDALQASLGLARIKTGTYTGNGATSQAITGVGFAPKYVKIFPRLTSDGTSGPIFETTDTIVDDNASGGSWAHGGTSGHTFEINQVISLDSDGFTVDDAGVDSNPNANGTVYNYLAIG